MRDYASGEPKPKKWKISIGGSTLEAELLERAAPVTCATLSKYLPFNGEATHSSWSGECIFVPWKTENIVPENQTIYGSSGDIVWNATGNDEIFIAHDVSQYRYRFGPLICNLFAKITTDLHKLEAVCNAIRREGTRSVSLGEI